MQADTSRSELQSNLHRKTREKKASQDVARQSQAEVEPRKQQHFGHFQQLSTAQQDAELKQKSNQLPVGLDTHTNARARACHFSGVRAHLSPIMSVGESYFRLSPICRIRGKSL